MRIILISIALFLALSFNLYAEPIKQYEYVEKEHTFWYSTQIVGLLYVLNWGAYYGTQADVFEESGSWSNYKNNFGELHFDKDASFWNLMVHPLTGSQVYLFYRAHGYSKLDSLFMTFVQSTIFEFTIEIYTEPASIQDLYQTPILGTILGYGIETLSLSLLNSGSSVGKFFGHLINPCTLIKLRGINVTLMPVVSDYKPIGLNLTMNY